MSTIGLVEHLVNKKCVAGAAIERKIPDSGVRRVVVRDEIVDQAVVEAGPQPASKRETIESVRRSIAAVQRHVSLVLDGSAGAVNEQQQHYLEIAKSCCVALGGQLDDLAAIPEMIAPKPLAMHPVVSKAFETMSPKAAACSVKLCYEIEVGLPRVMIDGAQMVRVLEILLDAAVRTTDAGSEVLVVVQDSRAFDAGNEITVQFRGPMIDSDEDLAGLFDSGTHFGPGLDVCKEIVECHGGRLRATAVAGRVDAFMFDLRGVAARTADREVHPELL